ncbi:MAG TPA: DUF6152 family protein [Bryobacteraceae bacterium]|nr:DUF6152 family protein [Bryobacteraceae bacterium]
MQTKFSAAVLGAGMLLAIAPAFAHHAFQAEYDDKKPVHLVGKVTEMEWINPHSWIHIDVTMPDGKVINWMVECGSPNIMLRRGFTKRSLEAGTDLIIDGYQAKSGEFKANGGSVTFKDGHRIFVGGSNPDDPGSKSGENK